MNKIYLIALNHEYGNGWRFIGYLPSVCHVDKFLKQKGMQFFHSHRQNLFDDEFIDRQIPFKKIDRNVREGHVVVLPAVNTGECKCNLD